MSELEPITENMIPVTVYVLWDGEHYLRETANGAGRVTNERIWVPATLSPDDPATEYWSRAGAAWAASRCGAMIRERVRWVEPD